MKQMDKCVDFNFQESLESSLSNKTESKIPGHIIVLLTHVNLAFNFCMKEHFTMINCSFFALFHSSMMRLSLYYLLLFL